MSGFAPDLAMDFGVPPVTQVSTPVGIYPGAATAVFAGGESLIAMYGPVLGGRIYNPPTAQEQGVSPLVLTIQQQTRYVGPLNTYDFNSLVPLAAEAPRLLNVLVAQYGEPESLFVSLTGPINLAVQSQFDFNSDFSWDTAQGLVAADPNVIELVPGGSFTVPANFPGSVWVNAITSGHKFSAVVLQTPPSTPPVAYAGAFPPSGPVTKTTTIPSYLYKQYEDDDNLQAFVAAQNAVTQDYVDTFNALNLPDYTTKEGSLLDWVGAGLYGLPRPTFFSGRFESTGPLDTVAFNDPPEFDGILSVTNFADVTLTSDDIYKRVLQWHLWRADGKQVSASWLRRRAVRFLFGETNQGGAVTVSVVSDESRSLTLTIVTGTRQIVGGAMFDAAPFNGVPFDAVATSLTTYQTPALAATFKEGIDSGALEMPEQYNVICRIGITAEATSETEILGLSALVFQ